MVQVKSKLNVQNVNEQIVLNRSYITFRGSRNPIIFNGFFLLGVVGFFIFREGFSNDRTSGNGTSRVYEEVEGEEQRKTFVLSKRVAKEEQG